MELSVQGDVEQLALDAIGAGFALIPEVSMVPASTKIKVVSGVTADEFVRVWASNLFQETLVTDAPTLTVEGWARTEVRAQRIMALAVAVLREQEGALFGVSQIGGVGNNPHPDYPSHFRYSALVEARVRASFLTI